MDRNYRARHVAGLDPETEYEQIYRIMVTHEFPWDMNQSLSFALYRYVLCTFVTSPIRWIDRYGWRRLTEPEKTASANYYRELGKLMGIKQLPATHQEFADVQDQYEGKHFGFDDGGLAVSEATLRLMATFGPNRYAPRAAVTRFAKALMDDPLLGAFGYRRPAPGERNLAAGALRLRGRVVRRLPPRREPLYARQLPNIRTYPDGYKVAELGTFPMPTAPSTRSAPAAPSSPAG